MNKIVNTEQLARFKARTNWLTHTLIPSRLEVHDIRYDSNDECRESMW